jgi:hypothetical protein
MQEVVREFPHKKCSRGGNPYSIPTWTRLKMAAQALRGAFRRPKRVDGDEEAPGISLFAIYRKWAVMSDSGVTCQYETCSWHTACGLVVSLTWCYHGQL